ncbi:phosphatidylinositol phosphate synthase [Alloscardovia venturai]|uniref:Phosphatidylinositol phosphate synthase n=1 Tax=Alloscardovia venturai TaxID=1769421 RepID=A0ABW2Y5H1_9BIFI
MLEKLRVPFKRLINPIARFLVRIGMTANSVTIIGALGTVLVAIITGLTGLLFGGALALTILVLFDALDGSVAALTGGGTKFGAFLDSTLDRIADWAMLLSIIVYFLLHTNPTSMWSRVGLWAAAVALMTSFVTPYARARAESVGYEAKLGIATRSDRILIILGAMALAGILSTNLRPRILTCAMVLLAVLGVITVGQRIYTVYQQSFKND